MITNISLEEISPSFTIWVLSNLSHNTQTQPVKDKMARSSYTDAFFYVYGICPPLRNGDTNP